MTLALAGVDLDLAVRTGMPSRLLVLETPRGEALLDTYGEWRSACRACRQRLGAAFFCPSP